LTIFGLFAAAVVLIVLAVICKLKGCNKPVC
jgi:hypothetical protein